MLSSLIKAIFCCIAVSLLLHAPISSPLFGWKYCETVGGCGYQQCKSCPVLAPAVLFAAITLGAIIAIAIKAEKEDAHTSHTHTHS